MSMSPLKNLARKGLIRDAKVTYMIDIFICLDQSNSVLSEWVQPYAAAT